MLFQQMEFSSLLSFRKRAKIVDVEGKFILMFCPECERHMYLFSWEAIIVGLYVSLDTLL